MTPFDDELRLLGLIVVNAAVASGAWRAAGRATCSSSAPDTTARLTDATLTWFVIQYVAVGLAGVGHLLTVPVVYAIALTLAGAAWWLGRGPKLKSTAEMRATSPDDSPASRWALPVVAMFVVGFLAAYVWHQRYAPTLATDALAYHLPAAVQWTHDRAISLYDVWYWNPANTYSPLAGSVFTTWLMAPLGNDALARFVQVPAVVLTFTATVQVARSLSLPAALVAGAAGFVAVSRAVVNSVAQPKDDLFVMAFFVTAIAALTSQRLSDRVAPWRFGAAVGLLLATKYTALLALPVLLLALDAPRRAGWSWRASFTALAVAASLAGPWYFRNWFLTGNPLFPVDIGAFGVTLFHGMFTAAREPSLSSTGAVWDVVTGSLNGVPVVALVPLLALAVVGLVTSARTMRSNPVARIVLIGPVLGLTIFLLEAPFAEVRFLFPFLPQLAIAAAVGLRSIVRESTAGTIACGVSLVALSAGTALRAQNAAALISFIIVGAIAVGLGIALAITRQRMPNKPVMATVASIVAVLASLYAYVGWRSFLSDYRDETNAVRARLFGNVWSFVTEKIPTDATIATAGATNVFPLYGFGLSRRVVHAPVRPGVHDIHDLPRLDRPTATAKDIIELVPRFTVANADGDTWLANLRASGAQYLYVAKHEAIAEPPELRFARDDARQFVPVYNDANAVVFAIRWVTP